jgi:hypothetical protein
MLWPFWPRFFFVLAAISLTTLVLAQDADEKLPTADSFGVEDDASGMSGTYVEVPVTISNVTNGPVQGIRLKVDYNESVLNLTDISNGDLTSGSTTWTQPPRLGEDRHTMVLAATHSGDAMPEESSGSVMLLNFHVIGSPGDTSPMSMILIELSNPEGEVGRTAPARDGTFTVTPSGETTATPTPTPSNGEGSDRGYVPTTPTPTEKPPEVAEVAEVAATPPATPTPEPVPRTPPLFLIVIVIAVIVIAGIIIMVLRR